MAIRRWVTWHGFALNVAPDVSGFAAITPCGIDGVVMTSVAREGGPSDLETVAEVVVRRFVQHFGYATVSALESPAEVASPECGP